MTCAADEAAPSRSCAVLMSCAGEVLRAPASAQKDPALSIAAPELGAKGAATCDVLLGIIRAAGAKLETSIELSPTSIVGVWGVAVAAGSAGGIVTRQGRDAGVPGGSVARSSPAPLNLNGRGAR
jgi:hypothetical protein